MPPKSVLLIDKKPKTIVFGHINGKEISLVVSTKKGNQNSKANVAEQQKVVKCLFFNSTQGTFRRLFILCVIGVKGNTQSKVNGRSVDQGTPFLSQEL